MKIGLTLLVRDEHDIIKQWLDFHIPKADFIVVTDNGSVDGTRDILEQDSDAIQIIDEAGNRYALACDNISKYNGNNAEFRALLK